MIDETPQGDGDDGESRLMGAQLERFYVDLMWELGVHAQRGGTAEGAGAVLKRVGRAHNVEAVAITPVPRLTREERADARWKARC